ncbi:MAG TPA: arginine deiminase family protein [Streptosporangiaceae bacterium]
MVILPPRGHPCARGPRRDGKGDRAAQPWRGQRSRPAQDRAAAPSGSGAEADISAQPGPRPVRPAALGGNALSLGRGLAVCDERNRDTNDRLAAAGVQVVTVPASELGSGRGGPRCLSCVLTRDPADERAAVPAPPMPDLVATRGGLPPMPRPVPSVSDPRGLPVRRPVARVR